MMFIDLPTHYALALITIIMMNALWLDHRLGEPNRFHPLIGFGHLVQWLESRCNKGKKATGILAWGLATIPITGAVFWLHHQLLDLNHEWIVSLFNIAILYLTIGQRSLLEHANWVYQPLQAGDLQQARTKVSWIVSRNTEGMNAPQITSSTIESVLENGNDAIFGALFWFALFGAPGAVLFRLVNTLDAMWGYKTDRWKEFGYFAAKFDDVMGWIPARLTALSYACLGNTRQALLCWSRQASSCASPNGGPVMTSGAGALQITIGGDTYYHGKLVNKSPMGFGHYAEVEDIPRAIKLVQQTSLLWLCVLSISTLVLHVAI